MWWKVIKLWSLYYVTRKATPFLTQHNAGNEGGTQNEPHGPWKQNYTMSGPAKARRLALLACHVDKAKSGRGARAIAPIGTHTCRAHVRNTRVSSVPVIAGRM